MQFNISSKHLHTTHYINTHETVLLPLDTPLWTTTQSSVHIPQFLIIHSKVTRIIMHLKIYFTQPEAPLNWSLITSLIYKPESHLAADLCYGRSQSLSGHGRMPRLSHQSKNVKGLCWSPHSRGWQPQHTGSGEDKTCPLLAGLCWHVAPVQEGILHVTL